MGRARARSAEEQARADEGLPPEGARLIKGTGPVPCDLMLVAEAGGKEEGLWGAPFVGKAGDVLTAYLKAVGIPRGGVFITNLYPYHPGPGDPAPTPAQIAAEEWRLIADLKRVKPRVVCAMGRLSMRWFLGPVNVGDTHGMPAYSEKAPGALVVGAYHVAAGFYSPATAALCQDDLSRVAYYLHNPPEVLTPPVPVIEEHHPDSLGASEVGGAIDTEGLVEDAWGLSVSSGIRPWGSVIVGGHPRLKGTVTFHHALHDLPVLRALGVDTAGLDYHDTMLMAFALQLEPQGLKALALRHLGLRMKEFPEVVRPHFDRAALAFLKEAALHTYPEPKERAIEDLAQRRWRVGRPHGAGRRILSILLSWAKQEDPEKPFKLEEAWEALPEEYRALAEDRVGRPFPRFSIHCVPRAEAVAYSGTDAVATNLVKPKLGALLDQRGLRRIYEMDRRALPFVDRLQETGMRVDLERLRVLEADLEAAKDKHIRTLRRIVGDRWFNPGSDDQVAKWLYQVRGIPVLKWTDGGQGSTSEDSLKLIRGYQGQDPEVAAFVTGVDEYREASKYLSTYVRVLFEKVRRDKAGDWRLYPELKATRVVSGRLSGWILTFPTRTDLGRRIRSCFTAARGWVVLSVDLSQIELRVMADHSCDPRMVRAFGRGEDLHVLTTSLIFKVPIAKVKKGSPQRYAAKTINFAVMYGISPRALLEQLYKEDIFDFTLEDCATFIREWFGAYPAVMEYLRACWKRAEKDGYIEDHWGRRRYLPNIRLDRGDLKGKAQRDAGNLPIQGGAHGCVKAVEPELLAYVDASAGALEPWMQYHDEFVLHVKQSEAPRVAEDVKAMMVGGASWLSVPVKADAGWGPSWGEAQH